VKIRFHIKHPSGYLLLQGLRLTARDWPCLFWACVASIPFALYIGSPLRLVIGRWIANREFANRIPALLGRVEGHTGNLIAASLKYLSLRIDSNTRPHGILAGVLCVTVLELAALLFIVAGTLYIYLGTEPPGFTVPLKSSAKYFWRFLRALFLGAVFTVPVLAALILLRYLLLAHVGRIHPAHTLLLYWAISAAVLLLLVLPMLLWLDLVEVYAVRNHILGNPRVRQGLLPALRLIVRHFFWIFPTFLLPYAVALGLIAACFFLWKTLIQGNHPWPAYLAAQIVLFLLLATRFWQRGMEVALVVAVERSTTVAAVLSQVQPQTQANPTLQELVQKLKKEPWAKADVPPLKTLFPQAPSPRKARSTGAPASPSSPTAAPPPEPRPPSTPPGIESKIESGIESTKESGNESLLAEHAKKTTLVEATAEEPAPEHAESVAEEPDLGPRPVPGPDSTKR
jgi:hypothetical protein